MSGLPQLLNEIAECTICAEHLELGPRPVVRAGRSSRIVIIGQAPGRRVHESGIPWDDPSGETLRSWLDVTSEEFYNPDLVAIVPMGFCYPGKGKSGDKPPRPECAPKWHDAVLSHLPRDRLEIVIGNYAQARYITDRKSTLTETVADWATHLPDRVVLPHPSPRNRHWLTKNPWFESETLPAVKARIRQVLAGHGR